MNDDEKKEGGSDESSKRVKVYLDPQVVVDSQSLSASLKKVLRDLTPVEVEAFWKDFGPATDELERGSEPVKPSLIRRLDWIEVWFIAASVYMARLLERKLKARATSIKQPPGSRLLKVTDFLCSPKTMRLTVNPLVADWRTEYFDALKEGREWKARWISARYYCAFGKALALDKVLGLLKAVSSAFSGG